MNSNSNTLPDCPTYDSHCIQKIDELHGLKTTYGSLKNSYRITKENYKRFKSKKPQQSMSQSKYSVNQPLYRYNTNKLDRTLRQFTETQDEISNFIKEPGLKIHKSTLSSKLEPYSSSFNPPFLPEQKPLKSLTKSLEKDIEKVIKTKEYEKTQGQIEDSETLIKIPHKLDFKYEPLEKFDEEILHDNDPESILKKGPIRGFSRWHEQNNELVWKECTIWEFDKMENRFLIQWNNSNAFKKVKRLNLMLEGDCESDFKKRIEFAKNTRLKKLYQGNMENKIEMQSQFIDLYYPKATLDKIVELSFRNSESLPTEEEKLPVIANILSHYKFHVLKFTNELNSTGSLQNLLKKFYPAFSKKPIKTKILASKVEIYEAIFQNTRDNQIVFEEDRKSMNLDNMFDFHLKRKPSESPKEESNPLLAKMDVQIISRSFIMKMRENLENLENYFQTFDKILDNKIYSKLIPMIISFVSAIASVNIFEVYEDLKNFKETTTKKKLEEIIEKCLEKVNSIDNIIFKVEKAVDEFEIDLKKLKDFFIQNYHSKIPENLIKDLLAKLLSIANNLIESNILVCLKTSLSFLIEKIQLYYSVIPFRDLSQSQYKLTIPEKFALLRKKSRKTLFFKEENEISIEENQDLGPLFAIDSQFIFKLWQKLMENCLNGEFHSRNYINLMKMKQPPIFVFKCVINASIEKKNRNKKTMKEREKIRSSYRDIIFNYMNQNEKILYEIIKQNEEIINITNETAFLSKYCNKAVSMHRFGWFNLNALSIKFDPPLEEFEQSFKESIRTPLKKVQKFEKVFDIFSKKSYNLSSFFTHLPEFTEKIDNFLIFSFYKLYSIMLILYFFDYLLIQKKTLVQDIIDDFKDLTKITQELDFLHNESEFFQYKLPDKLDCGLILLDLREIKRLYLDIISTYLSNLNKAIYEKFCTLLMENEKIVNNLLISLDKVPITIEEFIDISKYITGEEFKACMKKVKSDFQNIQFLQEILNNYLINYEIGLLQMYVESCIWIKNIKKKRNLTKKKLSETRPKFKVIIDETKGQLFEKFKVLELEMQPFQAFNDYANAYQYANSSKQIFTQLNRLVEQANLLNYQESFLKYEETDFKEFRILQGEFEKNVLLWDFAERWKFRTDVWMSIAFASLDEKEMVAILNEGTNLMNNLQMFFENNENVTEVLKIINADLNLFNKYLQVILLLKHESFLPRHWTMLWNEIFENKPKRFQDLTKLSFKDMLSDGILQYSSLIYKISNSAKIQYKVGLEISQLEQLVKELPFLVIEISSESDENFHLIGFKALKNPIGLIENMQDYYYICKHMRARIKYSEAFADRLNSLINVLKNGKKILKDLSFIQKNLIAYSPFFTMKGMENFIEMELISVYHKTLDSEQKLLTDLQSSNFWNFLTLFEKGEELKENSTPEKFFDNLKEMKNSMIKIMNSLNGLVKLIREKNPRFYFFSDEEILAMCYFTYYPKELFKLLIKAFEGIKELQYSLTINPITHILESLVIFGLINKDNEKVSFLKEMNFSYKDSTSPKLPILSLLSQIEDFSLIYLKSNIYKNLPLFAKNNLDFLFLWKNLAAKSQMLNQTFLLLNDICFSHDFSIILASFNTSDEIQVTLMGYLDTLKASLCGLTQFIREIKVLEKTSPNHDGKSFNFSFYSQFLLQILNYIEIVKYFIHKKLENIACFEFFIIPKFYIEINRLSLEHYSHKNSSLFFLNLKEKAKTLIQNYVYSTIPNLSGSSELLSFASQNYNKEDSNIEIIINCLHYKLNYGYELLGSPPSKFISTLSTKKLIFHAISAFANMDGLIIKGPNATGKRETIRSLAYLAGKPMFSFTFHQNSQYSALMNFAKGALAGGYWVFLGDIAVFDKETLSVLGEIAFNIRKAFAKDEKTSIFGSEHWKITLGFSFSSVFTIKQCDESKGSLSFAEIPPKVLNSFRITNLVYPDTLTIIEAFLFLMDFNENSLSFHAKQFLLFMNLLNSRISSSLEFNKDLINLDSFLEVKKTEFEGFQLDLKSIIAILNIAWGFHCDNVAVDEGIDKIALLKAAVERWLLSSIGIKQLDSFLNVFNIAFGLGKTAESETPLEVNSEYSNEILKILNEVNELSFKSTSSFTANKIQVFLRNILTKTNMLIIGKSSSGKSSLIKLAGHIYSELMNSNFLINWIKLDAIEQNALLGQWKPENQWKSGFLQQILEEMLFLKGTDNQIKREIVEINHLTNAKPASKNEEKLKKSLNSHESSIFDWLVFDSSSLMTSIPHFSIIETLLQGFCEKKLLISNSCILKIPNTVSIIFELENMHYLSPSIMNNYSLILMNEDLYSLFDEFSCWLNNLIEKSEFFKKIEKIVKILYVYLIEDSMTYVWTLSQNKRISNFTKKFYLKNFTSLLEIFLNELRKFAFSHGFFEDPKVLSGEKPMNIEIQRLLHKDHRASSITNREKSPYFEKLEFEVFSSVEALVVFTLFYTIGSNIKSFYQKDFEAFLLIKIKDLISTSNFYIRKTEDFACGVLPILEYSIKTSKKPFSDFCFNIIKRKWDSWEDIGIYDPENILTDFTSCDLNVKELVHFNKEFLNIESFQNQIENETLEMYLLPKNHIYCETLTWKKMNYFVNLAMAYLKPMTIVSNQQNGKTNFVKEKVWNLLSKADYSTFQLGLTRQTTILQFQRKFEKGLLNKTTSMRNSILGSKVFVFIDDLHLNKGGPSPAGIIRSFLEHHSWFSEFKNRYIKAYGRISLLMAYNFPLKYLEPDNSSPIFEETSIPLSLIEKSLVLIVPELSIRDIETIFGFYASSLFQKDLDIQKVSGLIRKAFIQTGFLYYKLKKDLLDISRLNCCWLGLNKFLQILKDLNSFDLLSLNPSTFLNNRKPFIYLLNKYLFDEFFQNFIIETDEDENLSSLEESRSKIDETSREDEESEHLSSQSLLPGEEAIDKLISPDNLLFFSNVGKSESISQQKQSFLYKQEEKVSSDDNNKDFIEKNLKIELREENPDEKELDIDEKASLRKSSGLQKLSLNRMNQKKRSNILLSPNQNHVNIAYEKSGTKEMKQSMFFVETEADNEAIMKKLEADFQPKLNRSQILQIPFEIFKEHGKLLHEGSDKGKEELLRNSFDSRNNILYYNRGFFNEKIEEFESESDSNEKNYFILLSAKKKPGIFKQIVEKYLKFASEAYQDSFEPFQLLNEIEIDHFCRTTLKLLHLLQISDLNLMLFSSVSLKCSLSIFKYVSSLIKVEFYSLDLQSEAFPLEKFQETLNSYFETSLKSNRNAVFFLNFANLLEEDPETNVLRDLLSLLQNLTCGYELDAGTYRNSLLDAYLQSQKTSDSGRHLNAYHHLHLLNEGMARKIRIVLNIDGNLFLKKSLRHKTILRDFEDFFRNFTRFYIYLKNISSEVNEILEENSMFCRNMEKVLGLSMENQDFVNKIKKAYIFEIEESKILLKETRSHNNLLSFQKFETLVCYIYAKIKKNLLNKFEKEKKSGVIGRVFDVQNTKFEKFNKEINKILAEKEKLEADLIEFTEKIKGNSLEKEKVLFELKNLDKRLSIQEKRQSEVFGLLRKEEIRLEIEKLDENKEKTPKWLIIGLGMGFEDLIRKTKEKNNENYEEIHWKIEDLENINEGSLLKIRKGLLNLIKNIEILEEKDTFQLKVEEIASFYMKIMTFLKEEEKSFSEDFPLLFALNSSIFAYLQSLTIEDFPLSQSEALDLEERKKLASQQINEIDEKTRFLIQEFENLQLSLSNKLKALDKKKQTFKLLMKLFENLNKILHFFIEQKITVSQDQSFIEGLSLYLSLLLTISFKHPSKYRIPLIQSLAKLIDFGLDPNKTPLYEILYDQAYIYEKMELQIPLNKLFLESLSALEFLLEFDIFYAKIIDPTGFAKKSLQEKFKKTLIIESWTKNKDSQANIEKAMIQGFLLIIEECDEELWLLVEPIIEAKYHEIKKEIAAFFINPINKTEESPKNNREENKRTSKIGESIRKNSKIGLGLEENTRMRTFCYNGKEIVINPKFRLCFITKQNKESFSSTRDLKMKILTINMDMSHEQVLSETLKDFFLIKFHPKQRNGLIIQGKEKIANKLNFYSDLEAIHKELEKLDVSNSENFGFFQTKLEDLELKYNIDSFLASKKVKYNPRKSIFRHRLDSITSLKNLVEEWDVRKFSLPKIDKNALKDEESESSVYIQEINKSNIFSRHVFEEENIIKTELEKKLIVFLPAKIRKLADQYEEVTRFIRRTYRVLKQLEKSFGEEYDFTEEFIFMNIEATIEGFENFSIEEAEIFDKITFIRFKRNFFQGFYSGVMGMLRIDHQTMFSFIFALEYLREIQKIRELDWKIFIEAHIDNGSTLEIFENMEYENLWKELNFQFASFHHLPKSFLAPLLSSASYDMFSHTEASSLISSIKPPDISLNIIKVLKEPPSFLKIQSRQKNSLFSSTRKKPKPISKPSSKKIDLKRRFSEKPRMSSSILKKKQENINSPLIFQTKKSQISISSIPLIRDEDLNVLPEKEAFLEDDEDLMEIAKDSEVLEEEKSLGPKSFGFKLQKVPESQIKDQKIRAKSSLLKEKLFQAKRKILINSKEQDQRVLGISAWKSLMNLVELLPRFRALKELVLDFPTFANEWKDFFFQSFKEIKEKDHDFPILPGNSHLRLSVIETLILMKYLRPEEIFNYIRNFSSAVFKRTLSLGSRTNLEFLNKATISHKPIIIFMNDNNRNIEELIELKAMGQKASIGTISLNCLNKTSDFVFKEIEKTAQKGLWLIIEDFELLDLQYSKLLIKKLQIESQNSKTSIHWKVWLLYRSFCDNKKKNMDITIKTFFEGCSRVFLNSPDNIKDQISSFYPVEIQEFEKKALVIKNKDMKTLSSNEMEIRLHRGKNIRKQDSCSLICLIERNELSQKNSNFAVLLDKFSEKLRFRLYFVYSVLLERRKYELNVKRYRKKPLFELPSLEFQYLLDDIFTFLSYYTINPFVFIEKAIVIERERFDVSTGSLYGDHMLRKMLTDYVFAELESQMVLDVKGFKYELFAGGASTIEEKIFKTIGSFPNEDPIELFGFNLNTEILENYGNSNKIMQEALKQEEIQKKAEIIKNNVLGNLENIKFLETDEEGEKLKSSEYLEGNLKEFLKFVLKILKDNEKSIETLIDFGENILKSIGGPFQLKDCRSYLGLLPKSEEKNLDILLVSWINEKMVDSSMKKTESLMKSPKYSILSLDTENSELFSEKFSFQKKKNNVNLKYFMKSPTYLAISPLVKKKHSQIEPLGIMEMNDDFHNNEDLNTNDRRKRAATYIKKPLNNDSEEQNFFRNFLLNEIEMANELIGFLRKDLQGLLDFFRGKEGFTAKIGEIHNCLKSNEIPDKWWKLGFVLKEQTLYEFLKIFLLKKELLSTIIFQRKCEVLPVIPLGKLFDPFNFLLSLAWDTSTKKNISIYNLKFLLEKTKTLDQKQNLKNGVLVSGFVIRGGRLNETSYYLEDENIREFETFLPIFNLICKKKFVKYEKKAIKNHTFSFEIYDLASQSDYEDQYKLQHKTPLTFFRYQNKSLSPTSSALRNNTGGKLSMDGGEKTIYYVKIPIVNPRNSANIQQYAISMNFFFKSMKPQDYWVKKGTEIYLDVVL